MSASASFRHLPTGSTGRVHGAPGPAADSLERRAPVRVTWDDQFSTVGSFTPAEFRAECERTDDERVRDSTRMVGASCFGCAKPGTKSRPVAQRDLGSPVKWHASCYRATPEAER